MIIRKPTKIELKVENDMQDYEVFREKLTDRLRAQKGGPRRDDTLFGNLMDVEKYRNRNYLFDSNHFSESSRCI